MSIDAMKQARNALEDILGWQSLAPKTIVENAWSQAHALGLAIEQAERQPDPCPYIRSTAEGTHHCALSQRPPLTEEEIGQLSVQCALVTPSDIYFARAIERAHGIGGGHD